MTDRPGSQAGTSLVKACQIFGMAWGAALGRQEVGGSGEAGTLTVAEGKGVGGFRSSLASSGPKDKPYGRDIWKRNGTSHGRIQQNTIFFGQFAPSRSHTPESVVSRRNPSTRVSVVPGPDKQK